MTATIDGLAVRPLAEADIARCVELNEEAGWNQVADDWRYMLSAGEGLGVQADDGRLVATAIVLPHGDEVGWIAMILVTAEFRRRGIASALMRRCIERCRQRGLAAGLDATEAGRPVYLPLGFHDVYSLTRWQSAAAPAPEGAQEVRRIDAAAWPQVRTMDAAVFGADRRHLLRHLAERCPEQALCLHDGGTYRGHVFARDGRLATQIGPLVALDDEAARSLLAATLDGIQGPVFLDLPDRHEAIARWLESQGFTRQRGYTRMLLDRDAALDRPDHVYCLAGPELG